MKLSALSFATFLIASVSAGCPFSHIHEAGSGVENPHVAANERSLKVHKTPLVHFKVPPMVRHSARTSTEGGVLSHKQAPTVSINGDRTRSLQEPVTGSSRSNPSYSNQNFGDGYAIPEGGYGAVRQSVIDMVMTNSQAFWPADFNPPTGPNYAGLLIRLAWHCNGSYRVSDGRGGCDGGAIRFPPESQWPDNESLNMALELLKPVKEKHGEKLSWGDLIVLAADAAIESMGGPMIGFCGGRIDVTNGDQSLPLGPSVIQQTLMPCGEDQCPVGEICPGCEPPIGSAAVGLIYVNPVGTPPGEFEPTAANIREVFARMGFDDRMTVAAIGGGHAFGKCHGPCLAEEVIKKCDINSENDNDNTCHKFCPNPTTNSTEGPYTWEQKMTSGLEVTWTRQPTSWSNEFFKNMFHYTWTNVTGPGGNMQWKPVGEFPPDIGMLTTDLALGMGDPDYEKLSREYAESKDAITTDFGIAWYQLMSRDVGPRSRCLGDELPYVQPWEESIALGPLTALKPNYIPVRSAIQASIDEEPSNIAAFATLALNCASTFRASDYTGGCNGAAIRYPPSIDWEGNKGTSDYLALLAPIKEVFPEVTWADLIVLAGQTAIEAAGGRPMPFCGGRVDANNGNKADGKEPSIYNNDTFASLMYDIANKGMSIAEGIALFATPNPLFGQFDGDGDISATVARAADNTTTTATGAYTISNDFFTNLAEMDPDHELLTGDFEPVVEEFKLSNDFFLEQYAMAFNYLMTADLFDGPSKNACQGVNDPTLEGETEMPPLFVEAQATPTSTTVDADSTTPDANADADADAHAHDASDDAHDSETSSTLADANADDSDSDSSSNHSDDEDSGAASKTKNSFRVVSAVMCVVVVVMTTVL